MTVDIVFQNLPRYLFISMLLLVVIHIGFLILNFGFGHGWVYSLSPLFNLDGEGNFPAWFSSIDLFISSLLLFTINKVTKASNPDKFWFFLAVIFLFLSLDEMNEFHERLINPLREALSLTNYFYFSWIILGIAFVIVIFCLSIPFLMRLPKRAALYFMIAGGIFVSGAIGMEMLSGKVAYLSDMDNLLYEILVTIEETMEMSSIVFFNYILVRYLRYIVNNRSTY